MNIFYIISSVITTITSLGLGTFVYLKAPKNTTNRVWFLMSIAIAVWSSGFGIMVGGVCDRSMSLFFERLSHAGAILIAIFYLFFMISLIKKEKEYRSILYVSYVCAFILEAFVFSKWFIIDVIPKQSFIYYPKPGIVYIFFTIHFFSFVLIAQYLGLKNFAYLSAFAKNQIRYVFVASTLGFLGGATTFPLVYDLNVPPIGGPLVFLYTIVITYAIVRYRLMDIRVAITRFGIFAVVYALVLGLPFWLGFKYGLWQYATWLMLVLATLGPFLYTRLEQRSKELIYKTDFKRYETLRKLSKTLLMIKDLDKLVELIVYRLVKTLKVSYAAIYLYDKEADAYVLKSYRPAKYLTGSREEVLKKDNPLIRFLLAWKKEIVREEVKNLPVINKSTEFSKPFDLEIIQWHMYKIFATLVIPHFIEDDLLGFLVLGDKEKGAAYTQEDISTLSALSNSAALAIENALFLIDLKITQAELFDAKRIAELGYMASAMGHEINNRLQGIYNIALDLTDNPLVYDIIKANPRTKEHFDKDIQRINENVEDATKIINELKTYARPQETTKQAFELVNLYDVISKALDIVRLQSIKSFDAIGFTFNILPNTPKVLGNFIQLQQVFVNMLNNAYDAILQMKQYLSEHPDLPVADYKGTIKLSIEEVKNRLHIHIIDNGLGMTDEIKKKIFIPLYTSKASSERKDQRGLKGGTGIGLYTIQTIIKGHSGTVSIHATEWLKGADFLITLPVLRET